MMPGFALTLGEARAVVRYLHRFRIDDGPKLTNLIERH